MKEFIQNLGLVLLIVLALVFVGKVERTYCQSGIIIEIENDNELIINDVHGEIWTCKADGFHEKDTVTMIMDNNYTKEKIDDRILKIVLDK